MTEPKVLATYNPNSPANIKFKQALREGEKWMEENSALIQKLGLLEMGLEDIKDRYANYLSVGNLFMAQVEDSIRLVVVAQIRQIKSKLGWDWNE
jgi:hypothetical protein